MRIFMLAGVCALTLVTPVSAAVITFDDLVDGGLYGPSLTTDGFTFTSSENFATTLFVNSKSGPNNADQSGATLSTLFYNGSITTIAKSNGANFILNSIDVADVYNSSSGPLLPYVVNFSFVDVSGVTSSAAITIDAEPGLQTFIFNKGPLASVSFTTGGNFDFLQFDNVRVDEVVAPAAVPEPATWATMLLGFGLIGAATRRRRRLAAA